ncbi:hypothetical protein [Actinophytocola sp.]|uniref:hypothetical protein n=1 Tax=Actinophytocola sp. TaxID=1872138 RepID=UPI002ED1E4A4
MAGAGGLTALRRLWSTGVRRWVIISALAIALALVVGLPTLGTSQGTRDARDVFCLQPSEQGALADAAVSLGVARQGSTKNRVLVGDDAVSVFDWRDEHNDDFVRACDALAAMRGKSATGTSVNSIVLPLLTVVLTSALTFASTRRQNRTTRGQADAGELRTAVAAYSSAANEYLDSVVSLPSGPATEMEAAREVLVGRLGAVVEREPDWLAVRDVVDLLRHGELGPVLDSELRDIKAAGPRGRRIAETRARIREVSTIGFLVADALAEHGGVDGRLTRPLAEGARP